ncbi:MAG: FRG domain-containing protein [Promethearchaeota archaeon]
MLKIEDEFETLDKCIAYIKNKYPESISNPKFLYRGEAEKYPHTYSSYDRLLQQNRFNEREISFLDKAIQYVGHQMNLASFPSGKTQKSSFQIQGYIQHYGFPTRLVDITSSLNVATYFVSKLFIGKQGRFCIIDIKKIKQPNKIIKLDRAEARRPKFQEGYTISLEPMQDLKSIEKGIVWLEFTIAQSDIELYFRPNQDINFLSTNYDNIAHRICYHMCQFVVENQKSMDGGNMVPYIESIIQDLVGGVHPICEGYLNHMGHKPPEIGHLYHPTVKEPGYVESWTNQKGLQIKVGMHVKFTDFKIDSGMIIEKKGKIKSIKVWPRDDFTEEAIVTLENGQTFVVEPDNDELI